MNQSAENIVANNTAQLINSCPVCQASKVRELFRYSADVPIAQCLSCGSQFSVRRFSNAELTEFYSSKYFHGDYGYKNYDKLEAMKRLTFNHRLIELEKTLGRTGTLLDIGCANGLLVQCALARGWHAFGIDISADAVDTALKSADRNPPARPGEETIYRIFDGRYCATTVERVEGLEASFDCISMSDLIEHVHNPREVLNAALRLLKPGGSIFIETPNLDSLSRKILQRRWPLYRPPEHLIYFTPESLTQLLAEVGCRVIKKESSKKAVKLSYLADKLAVTNTLLATGASVLGTACGDPVIWLPVGSFWVIAKAAR